MRVDEWPEAPRGGAEEVAALCERVRAYLRGESEGSVATERSRSDHG